MIATTTIYFAFYIIVYGCCLNHLPLHVIVAMVVIMILILCVIVCGFDYKHLPYLCMKWYMVVTMTIYSLCVIVCSCHLDISFACNSV